MRLKIASKNGRKSPENQVKFAPNIRQNCASKSGEKHAKKVRNCAEKQAKIASKNKQKSRIFYVLHATKNSIISAFLPIKVSINPR